MIRARPAGDILMTEHKMLAMRRVIDRCTVLRVARRLIRIIPVKRLPARDLGRQIGRVIRCGISCQRIEMIVAITPIPERRIPVDADEIDIRTRPERIQRKQDIARSVPRHIGAILGPVCPIGNLRPRQDRLHLRRERHQRLNERKRARRILHAAEAHHLAADQERLDPARLGGQLSMMQDEVPEPVRSVHETINLTARRRGAICRHADPPAPGKALAIHEQEGRQRHRQAPRFHLLYRPDDAPIRRRAPIIRMAVLIAGNDIGIAPRDARHLPRIGHRYPLSRFHARMDFARPRLDTGPEPTDRQRRA